MSGIAGIVNSDGSPVERRLLEEMVESSVRGIDGTEVWIDGPVGLGHALLRIGDPSPDQQAIATLDGQVWITADARIDDRRNLARRIASERGTTSIGAGELERAPDQILLLHAYLTWGERCVEHLLGDFAFAIWDGSQRRLWCVRDHLGIAPLYYARTQESFVFASELDVLRRHEAISDELNDLAVADFLLWGQKRDPTATTFAAVKRLPAAHHLSFSRGSPRIRRYWRLTVPPMRRPSESAAVSEFVGVLETAISDRLRGNGASILMSGGIDSPLIALLARRCLAGIPASTLSAHTIVFDRLIPDQERHFAAAAAAGIGIPIHYYVGDPHPFSSGWTSTDWSPPEPPYEHTSMAQIQAMRGASEDHRIALTGYDGDNLLGASIPAYFAGMIWTGQLWQAFEDARWYLRERHRPPPMGLRAAVRRRAARRQRVPGFPGWIDSGLDRRLGLRARWEEIERGRMQERIGMLGQSMANLELYLGTAVDECDPAFTGAPVSISHPLLDLRVIACAWSLPPIPWTVDKRLLRASGKGLPQAILRRPKTPAVGDPHSARLLRPEPPFGESPSSRVRRYVRPELLPSFLEADRAGLLWPRIWASSLDIWLQARGLGA